jgi:hypothetical protein
MAGYSIQLDPGQKRLARCRCAGSFNAFIAACESQLQPFDPAGHKNPQ